MYFWEWKFKRNFHHTSRSPCKVDEFKFRSRASPISPNQAKTDTERACSSVSYRKHSIFPYMRKLKHENCQDWRRCKDQIAERIVTFLRHLHQSDQHRQVYSPIWVLNHHGVKCNCKWNCPQSETRHPPHYFGVFDNAPVWIRYLIIDIYTLSDNQDDWCADLF